MNIIRNQPRRPSPAMRRQLANELIVNLVLLAFAAAFVAVAISITITGGR